MDVESIQFVNYVGLAPQIDAQQLWAQIFAGVAPQNFSTLSPKHSAASSLIGGDFIEIQVQANRIDFIIQPPPPNAPQSSPIKFVDYKASATTKLPYLLDIITKFPSIRLALVVQGFLVASSQAQSAEITLEMGDIRKAKGATSAQFHVSVAVPSTSAPNLQLVEVCRWAAAQKVVITQPAAPQAVTPPMSLVGTPVCQCYIDISTRPGAILPPGSEAPILNELLAEADDIATRGYAHFS